MRYVSTRGRAPAIGFREAVLSGLAPDGGLYMPERWPALDPGVGARPFARTAAAVLAAFADGEIDEARLFALAGRAYAAFEDPVVVAPLRPIGEDLCLLELFGGPSLAFKDVAMRMLAALYDWALDGAARRKTIIAATSGDTGGAAALAFACSPAVDLFILHPARRISDVQRRIMTTTGCDNVVNIAVHGSFDDCQAIVKTLFGDAALAAKVDLGGVNSINWVRLLVQATYYFTAAAKLGRRAHYVVPTGNFGDIFAGYAAARMGAPIGRLVAAVNRNDIVRRALDTGLYAPAETAPTIAPSMDIQVASNFERLLFEASGRDAAAVDRLMGDFARAGRFEIPAPWRAAIDSRFAAASVSEDEIRAEMARRRGLPIDPHTAVGLVAAAALRRRGALDGPVVALATAHPAKFPDAVESAVGVRPSLPASLADLFERAEDVIEAPADAAAIRALVLSRARG